MAVLPSSSGSRCCTCEDDDPCNCGESPPEPCDTATVYITGSLYATGAGSAKRSSGSCATGTILAPPPYVYETFMSFNGSSLLDGGSERFSGLYASFTQNYEFSPGPICLNPASLPPFDCKGSRSAGGTVTEGSCPMDGCLNGQTYQLFADFGNSIENDRNDLSCIFSPIPPDTDCDQFLRYYCYAADFTDNDEMVANFGISGSTFNFSLSPIGSDPLSISISTTPGGFPIGTATTNDHGERDLYAYLPTQNGETIGSRSVSGSFDVYIDELVGVIDENGDCVPE